MPKQDYLWAEKEDWIKRGIEKIGGKENETLYLTHPFVFYCSMITYCVFGAIKFYQLEVQCNLPVYLRSCVKYKLILLWDMLLLEIFLIFQGFLKTNPAISLIINIETSSIRKKILWFVFLCCLIHFYWRKFFQPFVFFNYLTIIIFFMLVLIFLKVFMYQVRRILCN